MVIPNGTTLWSCYALYVKEKCTQAKNNWNYLTIMLCPVCNGPMYICRRIFQGHARCYLYGLFPKQQAASCVSAMYSAQSSFQLSGPWSSKFGGHSPVGDVDVRNSNKSESKGTLLEVMFRWDNTPVLPEVVHKDAPSIPWLQRPKWPPGLCQRGSKGPEYARRGQGFLAGILHVTICWNTCAVANKWT